MRSLTILLLAASRILCSPASTLPSELYLLEDRRIVDTRLAIVDWFGRAFLEGDIVELRNNPDCRYMLRFDGFRVVAVQLWSGREFDFALLEAIGGPVKLIFRRH